MNWNSLALMTGIIFLYSFQTLFCTLYDRYYPGRPEWTSPVFCILESGIIVLITWALNGFHFHPSPLTLLFGALNALMLFGYNISIIEAGKRGSFAFFNVAKSYGSILVPLGYSVLFLREGTSVPQWIGVGLMLIAFLLMNREDNAFEKPKKGYWVFCALLFFTNGMYSVFVKMQTVVSEGESAEMIMLTFGIMGILAAIRLFGAERSGALRAFRQTRRSAVFLAACLVSAALAVNGMVYILPHLNSVVYFTAVNGGVLLLSCLYAFLLFHEKPTVRKIVGMLAAIVSVTLLSL